MTTPTLLLLRRARLLPSLLHHHTQTHTHNPRLYSSTSPLLTPSAAAAGGGGGSGGDTTHLASSLFSSPSSSSSSAGSGGTGTPSSLLGPNKALVSFDTYRVTQSLEQAGFSKKQAEVVMEIVVAGMEEATLKSTGMIATRRDLLDLKAELSEKVFNSTMRFDISQRHTKEMFERDLLSVRSDLKAAAHVEVQKLEREIVNLEKALTDRHITRRELTEQRVSVLQNEIAQVEKRILQYGAGTLISLLTVGLGFARLVM